MKDELVRLQFRMSLVERLNSCETPGAMVQAALDALDALRVLCAVREGPLGVRAVGELVESWVAGASAGVKLTRRPTAPGQVDRSCTPRTERRQERDGSGEQGRSPVHPLETARRRQPTPISNPNSNFMLRNA